MCRMREYSWVVARMKGIVKCSYAVSCPTSFQVSSAIRGLSRYADSGFPRSSMHARVIPLFVIRPTCLRNCSSLQPSIVSVGMREEFFSANALRATAIASWERSEISASSTICAVQSSRCPWLRIASSLPMERLVRFSPARAYQCPFQAIGMPFGAAGISNITTRPFAWSTTRMLRNVVPGSVPSLICFFSPSRRFGSVR